MCESSVAAVAAAKTTIEDGSGFASGTLVEDNLGDITPGSVESSLHFPRESIGGKPDDKWK